MGFIAPAAPFITAAVGVAQYKQQGAVGRYNQRVQERNATIKEQEAEQISKKTEFDISQFNKQFEQLQGTTRTNLRKAGVVGNEGTAARIALSNLYEAEVQRNTIRYNAQVAAAQKLEEANFARISGDLARQEARVAQIQTVAQTGTSLLRMRG